MGVDLKEIRISSVPETAKNLGFKKKKKKKNVAKISVIILQRNKFKDIISVFQGHIRERSACCIEILTNSSCSCNVFFLKMYILSFSIIQSTVVM